MHSKNVADRTRLAEIDLQLTSQPEECAASVALQIERIFVKERLDAYKYPVATLPNEIVSEIFIHFLPPYPLCPPLVGPFSPTHLTHICRHWRDIALSTPKLWRAMNLYQRMTIISPDLPDVWAHRARTLPLSIRMIGHDTKTAKRLLAAVFRYKARWEYIHLEVRATSSRLPPVEGSMPLLRQLYLNSGPIRTSHLNFSSAPKLQTVIMDFNVAHDSKLILPFAQLRTLGLMWMDLSVARKFLAAAAANLVECELDISPELEGTRMDVISLPRVEHLRLNDVHENGEIGDCLQYFELQNLRCLDVAEVFMGNNPVDSLQKLIERSNGCPHLHTVCVRTRLMADYLFRQAFPKIEFLFDDNSDGDRDGPYCWKDIEDEIDYTSGDETWYDEFWHEMWVSDQERTKRIQS
ncbi:F-box domain-containing protein [Favolaschia claudopus]|uniref:F-box domain-containing protein n=1 Tax=Favolaschia claudopus TaxID=2862362 RepID=A0AAW0DLM6_9AGAR